MSTTYRIPRVNNTFPTTKFSSNSTIFKACWKKGYKFILNIISSNFFLCISWKVWRKTTTSPIIFLSDMSRLSRPHNILSNIGNLLVPTLVKSLKLTLKDKSVCIVAFYFWISTSSCHLESMWKITRIIGYVLSWLYVKS